MKKFDIRKTFDTFLREPVSILTEGLFQLVNIENNIFSKKPYVNVDFVNKKTQITVVNSEKMYNLFQKVLFKRKLEEQKEKAKSEKQQAILLLKQLSGNQMQRCQGAKRRRCQVCYGEDTMLLKHQCHYIIITKSSFYSSPSRKNLGYLFIMLNKYVQPTYDMDHSLFTIHFSL